MMGGLRVEMNLLMFLGDCPQARGWIEALVQANITTYYKIVHTSSI